MANKDLVIESSEMNLEQKCMALLMCLAQEIKVDIESRIGGEVQSLLQLNLLHALASAPEGTLTVSQLKGVMVDESPNVSRTVSKLAEMGLVTKSRSVDDQRSVFVTITEAGEGAHERADAHLADLSIGLEGAELEQLFTLLKRL